MLEGEGVKKRNEALVRCINETRTTAKRNMIVRKLDRKVCKRHVRTTIDCKTKDLNHTLWR